MRAARARSNNTGFSGIPPQVGNHVTRLKPYMLTFRDTVSCYPEDDTVGGFGAFSTSIAASQPNYTWGAAAHANHLGNMAHADMSNTLGLNQQCEHAFSNYASFTVKWAKIELMCTPTGATQDSWDWTAESSVFLTLSKDKSPWSAGTTVAGLATIPAMKSGRNVVEGLTLHTSGTKRGCSLSGVYTPRRLYQLKDLQDRTGFRGLTQGDYMTPPTVPSHEAYWNIVIVSKSPFAKSAGGASFTQGVPFPHRLDIKVTYMCNLFAPDDPEDNAPM